MLERDLNPPMPEHDDPHPLEEEILLLLESLVSTEIADKCVSIVSQALVCPACAKETEDAESTLDLGPDPPGSFRRRGCA